MMGYEKVYYKNFKEGFDYRSQRKFLPYAVKVQGGREKVEEFKKFLKDENFAICAWNETYDVILVSMRFRRAAMIHRPCKFPCKHDRRYTVEEFLDEVYYRRKPPKTRKTEWDLYSPKEKMVRYPRLTYSQYLFRVRRFCRQKYLPGLTKDELDSLFREQDEYLQYQYDLMKSLLRQYNMYRKKKDFMGIEQTAYILSLKYEDFEFYSKTDYSESDKMTDDQREAYYREHPFRYKTLDEYVKAIEKWIWYKYDWDHLSFRNVPATINAEMDFIRDAFAKQLPVDSTAVDIMFEWG